MAFKAPTIYQTNPFSSGGLVAPGFSFGKQGTVRNAFLLANNVPSDTTGFPIRTLNTVITYIAASNDNDTATYEAEVYEHNGTTFTLLTNISITTARSGDYTPPTPIAVTTGYELAVKINNVGSATNPVVILFTVGDVPA